MNCAIYIRKSREDKNKPAHRLTVQRQQLPAHAKGQGWTPVIYDDGHASAARGKVDGLQQRNRLETDVRNGEINIILTIELSRLSRDDSMQDYVAWLHLCSQFGVKLATTSRILDPAQHSDWMLLLMEGGFSSVEMKVLQARMKEGRAEAFRAGKYLSGRPPMPYKYDKQLGGLVVDKEQTKLFNKAVRMAENTSIRGIAKKLNLPLNKIRRMTAEDRLLFYLGKRLDPETGEEIEGQWPAVITEEQAEAIRKNKLAGHRSPRRNVTSMLSSLNLFTCKYCGRAVRSWANGRKKVDGTRTVYYGCGHIDREKKCEKARLVQQQIIDELVLTNIANTLANIDRLKTIWIKKNSTDNSQEQIEQITRELENLKTQKSRLINAITEGVIDFADAKQKRLEIDTAINACEKRQAELTATAQNHQPPDWDSLNYTKEDFWLMTVEELRKTIQKVINKIEISHSRMVLTYNFPRHTDGRETAEMKLPPPMKPGVKTKKKQ